MKTVIRLLSWIPSGNNPNCSSCIYFEAEKELNGLLMGTVKFKCDYHSSVPRMRGEIEAYTRWGLIELIGKKVSFSRKELYEKGLFHFSKIIKREKSYVK